MPRGRPPKPTEIKILEGNLGRRPLNINEPKPKFQIPKCPSWLSDVARKEWRRVVPELERLGLLTCVDGAALEGYCQAYGRWVEAEQFMSAHGTIFKTPSGYIQQVPQVAIAQKYLAIVKGFYSEFGLTPSSRSRMEVPNQDNKHEESEADSYLDALKSKVPEVWNDGT